MNFLRSPVGNPLGTFAIKIGHVVGRLRYETRWESP